MKVLFVNPPTSKGSGSFNRPVRWPSYSYATGVLHPPIFLASAAAYLRSKGYSVDFVDCQAENMSTNSFITFVKQFSPDLLVFETSTISFRNDVQVVRALKRKGDFQIVFVGAHVSAEPKIAMKEDCIDAVLVGEYDESLYEYVKNGPIGTNSICYREEDGKIVLNPRRAYIQDLDALPIPARDLLKNEKYFDPILKNPFTFIIGGRGYPFQCIYCCWPQVMQGHKYRFRSAKNIVDEIELLEDRYNFESYLFNDDTFTVNKDHALAVCDEILNRGLNIKWACYARADERNKQLFETLKKAGCYILKVGVESGDQNIINNMRKGYKKDNVVKGVNLMKKSGFHVHATYVFGLPGETKETILKTINFAEKLNTDSVQFSIAQPYPGTEFFKYIEDKGLFIHYNENDAFNLLEKPLFEYPSLSAEDLIQAVRTAYKRYYFRSSYVFNYGLKALLEQPSRTIKSFFKLSKLIRTRKASE